MSQYQFTLLKTYDSIFELAKDIYKYPGRFSNAFKTKELMDFIKEQDQKKYEEILKLRRKNYIPDVFLSKASYILNPHMELRYHHFIFKDYEQIGKQIKKYSPKIDVYIQDLLRFGLLEEYMIAQGDNYKKPELYARVKKVIDDYKKDKNLAYFELAYALDQSKEFIYEGVKYTDPKVFLQTRLTIKNLFDFARTFEENKAFFAWLKAIDQEQIIFRYKSLISLVEEKEQECVNNDYVNKQNKNSDKLAFFYKELESK